GVDMTNRAVNAKARSLSRTGYALTHTAMNLLPVSVPRKLTNRFCCHTSPCALARRLILCAPCRLSPQSLLRQPCRPSSSSARQPREFPFAYTDPADAIHEYRRQPVQLLPCPHPQPRCASAFPPLFECLLESEIRSDGNSPARKQRSCL